MTLPDALKIALAAYDEDEAERERILELLALVLMGDRELFRSAFLRAWECGRGTAHQSANKIRDEIRAALTEYQTERARIDAEGAEVADAYERRHRIR